MAIAHDATTPEFDTIGEQNPTASHTAGSLTNGVAIISVGWQDSTPGTLTTVTYGGAEATALHNSLSVAADIKMSLWLYKNPPAGGSTVQANFSEAINGTTIRVSTYSGVDQTTSTGSVATNSGSSTTASVDVSSAAGELVIDAVGSGLNAGSTGSATVGADQTSRANFAVSGNHRHLGSEEPGAGTVTMSWEYNATRVWGSIGVALKPAGDSASRPMFRGS